MRTPPNVHVAGTSDRQAWAMLRRDLWPHYTIEAHLAEIDQVLADANPDLVCLLATRDAQVCGFAEIALRHDYVNGCDTSPVAFLEGIYVAPGSRRQGVARALVTAAETWAGERGCTEFASDALIDNIDSAAMHAALGFAETQRVIYFRKTLPERS